MISPGSLPSGLEPSIDILIQPKQHGQRFRYKCESRSAGSLIGEGSTNEQKTYPTVEIKNLNGQSAIVVISCVSKDPPYHPHPHNLVGTGCKDGVCTIRIKPPSNTINLNGVGIQCCKKNEVRSSLETRNNIRVNPFGTTPDKDEKVDLSVVRLCFQAFLPDHTRRFTRVLTPVVSQPIIDKKTVHDLIIVRLSLHSGSVNGGDDMIILCEKVKKEDIQVRFYQQSADGEVIWEAYADINSLDVHHQYAICFKTPPYRDRSVRQPVSVMLHLVRPSTNEVGDPKPFMYRPAEEDPDGFMAKRRKTNDQSMNQFFSNLSLPTMQQPTLQQINDEKDSSLMFGLAASGLPPANHDRRRKVDREPRKVNVSSALSSATDQAVKLPTYTFNNLGSSFVPASCSQFMQDDLSQASAASGIMPLSFSVDRSAIPTSFVGDDGTVYFSAAPATETLSSLDMTVDPSAIHMPDNMLDMNSISGQINSADLMQILQGSLTETTMPSEEFRQYLNDPGLQNFMEDSRPPTGQ